MAGAWPRREDWSGRDDENIGVRSCVGDWPVMEQEIRVSRINSGLIECIGEHGTIFGISGRFVWGSCVCSMGRGG